MRNIDKIKQKLPFEHSRSFLENIVVNGPFGILMTDYNFIIKYMNNLAYTIHNIERYDNSTKEISLTDCVIDPKNILKNITS